MRVRGSRFGVAFIAAGVLGFTSGTQLSAQEAVHDLHIRLEAHGGVPVPGALVALVATNGETVAEGLSGENGVRVLRAPAGSYRVRVRRIGFRPFTSATITLPRAGELLLRVELWLDEQSAELRELDYRYVNAGLLTTFRSTGYTRFRRMPSGAWLVDEWWLRMPLLERRVRGGLEQGVYAIGRVETGGDLLQATDASGESAQPQDSLAAQPAAAETATRGPPVARPSAALRGQVIDGATRQPLSSAEIAVGTGRRTAVTADDGAFAFSGLAPGAHVLSVRRVGYARWQDTVRLREGETQWIEIALGAQAVSLAPVSVEAERGYLGGFWERRATSPGHFFTRDDILRRNPARLVEMFHGVPGARIIPTGWGQVVGAMRGPREFNPTGNCIANVFVDGAQYQMTAAGLNDILLDHVEAVEYYSSPARIPAQFNITGRANPALPGVVSPMCGVVVIWTRGRE